MACYKFNRAEFLFLCRRHAAIIFFFNFKQYILNDVLETGFMHLVAKHFYEIIFILSTCTSMKKVRKRYAEE